MNLSTRSLFRLHLQPQVWETVYKNPCNILNTLPYSMALVFTHSLVAIEPWQLLGMGCRQEELFLIFHLIPVAPSDPHNDSFTRSMISKKKLYCCDNPPPRLDPNSKFFGDVRFCRLQKQLVSAAIQEKKITHMSTLLNYFNPHVILQQFVKCIGQIIIV